MHAFRKEHDSLGEVLVPIDAYYGCQTLRAIENFQITGELIHKYPSLISALAQVKKAAALANNDLGLLSNEKKEAISICCDELVNGALLDQFLVDCIQGGAGTSTNMNANEVICNRALELMGHEKGEYQYLHPNNDVNMSQSTNDVYPTALRIALINELKNMVVSITYLCDCIDKKS